MASGVYNEGKTALVDPAASPAVNFDSDTIKAALITDAYTFSTAHSAATVLADRVNGAEAAQNTQTLAAKEVGLTGSTMKFDNTADLVFPSVTAGATVHGVLIYEDDATDIALFFLDVTDTPTNGGDITIQFHSNGIATC